MRKKFTRILVMLVVIVATNVQAFGQFIEPFEEGGIWYLKTSPQTSTVAVVANGNGRYTGVVDIPAKVTHDDVEYSVVAIGEGAFWNCSEVTEVTILGEVTKIDYGAFVLCSKLESIELPSSLETIDDMAFLGCESLKTITLPSKVSSIGDAAFSGCKGLESITSNNPVPPTCTQAAFAASSSGLGVFAGVNNDIPVYVPDGKENAYKNADGWDYFNGTITKVEDSLIGDAVEVERYDISGRKISKPVQGVNIVRYSNGAVRKETR